MSPLRARAAARRVLPLIAPIKPDQLPNPITTSAVTVTNTARAAVSYRSVVAIPKIPNVSQNAPPGAKLAANCWAACSIPGAWTSTPHHGPAPYRVMNGVNTVIHTDLPTLPGAQYPAAHVPSATIPAVNDATRCLTWYTVPPAAATTLSLIARMTARDVVPAAPAKQTSRLLKYFFSLSSFHLRLIPSLELLNATLKKGFGRR